MSLLRTIIQDKKYSVTDAERKILNDIIKTHFTKWQKSEKGIEAIIDDLLKIFDSRINNNKGGPKNPKPNQKTNDKGVVLNSKAIPGKSSNMQIGTPQYDQLKKEINTPRYDQLKKEINKLKDIEENIDFPEIPDQANNSFIAPKIPDGAKPTMNEEDKKLQNRLDNLKNKDLEGRLKKLKEPVKKKLTLTNVEKTNVEKRKRLLKIIK